MTNYDHCNKCDTYFSLEQSELVPNFCVICGTRLEDSD